MYVVRQLCFIHHCVFEMETSLVTFELEKCDTIPFLVVQSLSPNPKIMERFVI